jgi:gliding motility-associated lipoprotein GldH
MKKAYWLLFLLVAGCDSTRLYEQNHDFEKNCWKTSEKPEFSFHISDTTVAYNLYANIRNDTDYPFSNLYFNFRISDTTGVIHEKLLSAELFDRKTGKPLGSSGIGFLFDHRVPLLQGHRFTRRSTYTIRFEHFMRKDTICGIRAIGLRVETMRKNE